MPKETTKTIHSDKHERLRELLLQARKRKGLTQVEVAKQLKVPQSWVTKVETGERRLDVVEFSKLVSVLGINVNRFFRDLEAPPSSDELSESPKVKRLTITEK